MEKHDKTEGLSSNSDMENIVKELFFNKKELPVEITIQNFDTYLTVRCPDEDDQISITIKNRYRVTISLTLDEAKELADYLSIHVKNAIKSNN